MNTVRTKRTGLGRLLRLPVIYVLAIAVVASLAADSALALRAPLRVSGSETPYYYVSDKVADNGKFPDTWVGFYWDSDSGDRTINYVPRKCNSGGYNDNTDGDPVLTIYGINEDGTVNKDNVIIKSVQINACHNGDKDFKATFKLSKTLRDKHINMKGVVVRVQSKGRGTSRAWFSLTTPDVDGASFGVMGGKPVGYSRDFSDKTAGGYYDLRTGFGSCLSPPANNQLVQFFDTDNQKYQNSHDNRLRIQFKNLSTNKYIDNDSKTIHGLSNITRRDGGSDTWFNIMANSAQVASLRFDMAKDTGYQLDINHLREGNDITVLVPTNEIYGKRPCVPPAPKWTMRGYTEMTSPGIGTLSHGGTVAPDQKVTFWHHVVNDGGVSTGQDIWADTKVSGGVGTSLAMHNVGSFKAGEDKDVSNDTITIPSDATVGQQYCQRVGYQATASDNSAYSNGEWACVVMRYAYELTPSVTVSPGSVTRVGENVMFSYDITNNTWYKPEPYDWYIEQTVTEPNKSPVHVEIARGANNNPTTYMNNNPHIPTGPTSIDSTSYPVGTVICHKLTVDPATDDGESLDAESCTTIAASPYITVIGGNTWSGGSTDANAINIDGKITGANSVGAGYGSFGEYGVFATGSISLFGSAGRLGVGSSTTKVDGTRLTFASANSLGGFTNRHEIVGRTSRCAPPLAGSVTINSSTLTPANPRQLICADTVTISGDITYGTGAKSFGTLPSLTVIANTIQVDGSVTEIAGNFYAKNQFKTCSEGPITKGASGAITTTGTCSRQLTINGTVTVANQAVNSLVLNRSYGGAKTGEPSEIIRMRPESFLTPFENSNSNSLLTTVLETELPARY